MEEDHLPPLSPLKVTSHCCLLKKGKEKQHPKILLGFHYQTKGMESDYSEYVEVDPTGRYGRYTEILGKGASKIVYRAFDEYEGIEVAWNQVKFTDFLHSSEDLERLYSEIHLLRTLNHSNIMKFYSSWVDTANRNINFITEMFTSGTLKQYRLKHKRVNIRAVKHWCRQILKGLVYLHSLDPPVIHRDLKCDNIFINGNQGQLKIGDLGLAAILRKSYAARCVGTPEFMAPEVYEEEYNELVDIYSFGMCVLEMVTFEYPYKECTHPAQIYKKGTKPDALYKVKDPEVRQFVDKCLATVSSRLSARELLKDPFLKTGGHGYNIKPFDYHTTDPVVQPPSLDRQPCYDSLAMRYSDFVSYEPDHGLEYQTEDFSTSEIDEFFMSSDHDHLAKSDITIKGKSSDDGSIFFRLRTIDKQGHIRNIYFPFDIENDTALSVATEMVAELDMIQQEATKIADMIDGEIASLVPDWNKGERIEEEEEKVSVIENSTCTLNLDDYVTSDEPTKHNLQVLECSGQTSTCGRFEQVTYQVDATEQNVGEGAPSSSQSDHQTKFTDIWAQQGKIKEEEELCVPCNSPDRSSRVDGHENQIRKELRWLKATYQKQLSQIRDKELRVKEFRSCSTHSLHRATSLPVDAISQWVDQVQFWVSYWSCQDKYHQSGEVNFEPSSVVRPVLRPSLVPLFAHLIAVELLFVLCSFLFVLRSCRPQFVLFPSNREAELAAD
ncbi:hypothetical protein V2J09_011426 [Rumex salicifolius]